MKHRRQRQHDPDRPVEPEKADAWLASIIGQRGSVARISTANPDQRKPALWWLRKRGIPSPVAAFMSSAQMLATWNDTTDTTLQRFVAMSEGAQAQRANIDGTPKTDAPPAPTPTPTPAPQPAPIPAPQPAPQEDDLSLMTLIAEDKKAQQQPAPAPVSGDVASIANTLATMLAGMAGPKVDEDVLRKIVREEVDRTTTAPRALLISVAGLSKELPKAARHPLFPVLLALVANKQHVAIVGPAGSGKTHATEDAAKALGLSYYYQGAVSGAHELRGYKDGNGTYHTTAFRQAFEHGGLICLDEVDAGDPAAILVMNAALSNGHMDFPDAPGGIARHANFRVVATANTYGRGADRLYVGRNQLDAATISRFGFLDWDYDDRLERELAQDDAWVSYVQAARKIAREEKRRVVFCPRSSINGAVMLAAGLSFDTVADVWLWKGLDAEARKSIEDKIPAGVKHAARLPRAQKVAA